jgi:DNA-binding response OmpR family regulator
VFLSTILLIEDALDLAQVIVRELTAANYQMFHAPDGLTGLALHEAHKPDLIILDWMLPGMDGIEILRRLRQTSVTPVLMLTARTEEIDRVIGLEVGADDYLTKPFGMRELIARVRAMLRRVELMRQMLDTDRNAAEMLQQGALNLDPQGYLATLDGSPLELSQTEFRLLHLLLRYPGRAFSRLYLIDTIWGETYVEGDRAVDSAILRLRRKLGVLGDAIETVRGVGYRWKLRP